LGKPGLNFTIFTKRPIETKFKSFNEVFVNYTSVTYTPIKGDLCLNCIKILKNKYEKSFNEMVRSEREEEAWIKWGCRIGNSDKSCNG
jgi:hypothetical protein